MRLTSTMPVWVTVVVLVLAVLALIMTGRHKNRGGL
jgi:hypothetical protein